MRNLVGWHAEIGDQVNSGGLGRLFGGRFIGTLFPNSAGRCRLTTLLPSIRRRSVAYTDYLPMRFLSS